MDANKNKFNKEMFIGKIKKLWSHISFNLGSIDKFKTIFNRNKKLIIIIAGVVAVIILMAVLVFGKNIKNNDKYSAQQDNTSHKMQTGDYINQRLQDISDQLATIRSHIGSNNAVSLDSLNQQLLNLDDEIKQLSSDSNKIISDAIESNNEQLQKELEQVNIQLKKLQEAARHIKYLQPSDLPFQVLSIDNIQQSDVVTINYNHTTFPITIDSYVANWKLIAADFILQKAEFVNAKKQHIIIDLNRLNEN